MRKMLKKTIAIVITMIVLISNINSAKAINSGRAENEHKGFSIIPLWNNVRRIDNTLSSSGRTVYIYTSVKTINSSINTSGTVYLQRKVNGSWSNITSYSISGTGDTSLSRTYSGTSGSEYRIKAVLNVGGESITSYSNSKKL